MYCLYRAPLCCIRRTFYHGKVNRTGYVAYYYVVLHISPWRLPQSYQSILLLPHDTFGPLSNEANNIITIIHQPLSYLRSNAGVNLESQKLLLYNVRFSTFLWYHASLRRSQCIIQPCSHKWDWILKIPGRIYRG